MSAPTTNTLVKNPTTGEWQDLNLLFLARLATDPIAEPTGFTYFDGSGNTDLNALFYPWSLGLAQLSYKTNMVSKSGDDLTSVFVGKPNTNYLVLDPNTNTYNDLSQLFLQRRPTDPSANPTGFYYNTLTGKLDLNTLFYPWSSELPQVLYNTNMISLNGLDLNKVFYVPSYNINDYINVAGLYTYSLDVANKYFIVVFANYTTSDPMSNPSAIGYSTVSATLTFKTNVKNVQFTLIGGGGAGGAGGKGLQSSGGGGGEGGAYALSNITTVAANTVCNIQVGGGGTDSIVTFLSYAITASGGAYGTSATTADNCARGTGGGTPNTPGAGGNGGTANAGSTKGQNGFYNQIYSGSASYYFGGGGAGGSAQGQLYSASGGLGGGGGSGNGCCGNNAKAYTGPNGILYSAASFPTTGWPATGGGGSGGNGINSSTNNPGGVGGSGIVICCFQLA